MVRSLPDRLRPKRRGRSSALPGQGEAPHLTEGGLDLTDWSRKTSLDQLRHEWRRLYRSEPPRISRDLLIRGVGYRLQEIQHGGLGKSTRRAEDSCEDVPD